MNGNSYSYIVLIYLRVVATIGTDDRLEVYNDDKFSRTNAKSRAENLETSEQFLVTEDGVRVLFQLERGRKRGVT